MSSKLIQMPVVLLALLLLIGACGQSSMKLPEWSEKGILRNGGLSAWCINVDQDWYLQVRFQSKHSESASIPLSRLSSSQACTEFLKQSGIVSIDLVDGSLVVDTGKRQRYFPITLPGFYDASTLERVPWMKCLQPSSRVSSP